jgi:SAM-dependent methyltransferase
VYAEWLTEHGAEVVALDVSPKMVQLAKERLGGKAHVLQADFDQPLSFLASGSFDLVLSALALDYIKWWDHVFREFYRLLRQPGHLVFSIGHPLADFLLCPGGNYFETELFHWVWKGFGIPVRMPSYRRPLSAVIDPLLGAGFVLQRILEPTPTEQFRQEAPEDYEKLTRQPGFLCLRAAKEEPF